MKKDERGLCYIRESFRVIGPPEDIRGDMTKPLFMLCVATIQAVPSGSTDRASLWGPDGVAG